MNTKSSIKILLSLILFTSNIKAQTNDFWEVEVETKFIVKEDIDENSKEEEIFFNSMFNAILSSELTSYSPITNQRLSKAELKKLTLKKVEHTYYNPSLKKEEIITKYTSPPANREYTFHVKQHIKYNQNTGTITNEVFQIILSSKESNQINLLCWIPINTDTQQKEERILLTNEKLHFNRNRITKTIDLGTINTRYFIEKIINSTLNGNLKIYNKNEKEITTEGKKELFEEQEFEVISFDPNTYEEISTTVSETAMTTETIDRLSTHQYWLFNKEKHTIILHVKTITLSNFEYLFSIKNHNIKF